MKKTITYILILISTLGYSQKRIKIINADYSQNHEKYPNTIVAIGNVVAEIDGATLRCKRIEYFTKRNYLKAMGNVVINQADTIVQTSDFADYDGNQKLAKAWGNVVLRDPTTTISTEKLYFDRNKQKAYYNNKGKIVNEDNTLTSKKGKFYLESKMFQAKDSVIIKNPEHVVESDYVDYYTNSGDTYLYEPSTITSKSSVVYTEKGYTNSKTKVSHLTKNSWIQYTDRKIYGDSIYHNGNTNFASVTGNLVAIDTINNSIIKGGYAEFFRAKDSAYVVDRAEAISIIEQDSLHMHGDTLMIIGPAEKRLVKAFHHVKFFKSDLSGKCDSLVSVQSTGITTMYRKPVLWSDGNQITGDSIKLLSNTVTEQLDSLKVLNNAFMVQKDTAGTGFNQIKGRHILGKFVDNEMKYVDVVGNGDVIYYVRNDEGQLDGITKIRCSNIHLIMNSSKIEDIFFYTKPDGKTYPEKDLHVNDRKLRGFVWREDERPKDKHDIFRHDIGDDTIIEEEKRKEREQKRKKSKVVDDEWD